MKNRVLLLILTLIFLVSIAYAGINDRFANLELVDVTSTAAEINKLHGIDSGDVVTTTNTKTLTNKTLTSPTINTQIASGGTFNIPTLTTPVIVSLYQDSGRTKLMTIPNTASDTLVALTATQTLTNKTLTSPTINTPTIDTQVSSGGTFTNPTLNFYVATHEYTTNADWDLSTPEASAFLLIVSSGSTGVNIVAPNTTGRMYALRNGSGQTVTLKKSGGTGISVATGKTAILFHSGTDYVRITADATH